MSKKTGRVTVKTVTTTTYEITADEIRKWQRLPKDARVEVKVPGGGDWSNTDLSLDDCPVVVSYTVTEGG